MLFLTSLNAIKSVGPLGTDDGTKTDEFWENFRGGRGSFSIQKFMLQILDLSIGLFSDVFRIKLEHDFPKMSGRGQRPFGIFPKIQPFWYPSRSSKI